MYPSYRIQHYLLFLQLATLAAACSGNFQPLEATALSPSHTLGGLRGQGSRDFAVLPAAQHGPFPLPLLAISYSSFNTQVGCHPTWEVIAVQEPTGLKKAKGIPAPQATAQGRSLGYFPYGRNMVSLPRSGPILGRFPFIRNHLRPSRKGAWNPSFRNHTPH